MVQIIMEELISVSAIDKAGEELVKNFSGFLSRKSIGKTGNGNDIFMYILGHGEKAILLTAGVHARETVNPAVLIKMLFYYCEKCEQKERILEYNLKDFFEEYSFLVIPLVNPDGYTIARTLSTEWKENAYGVDINRNFPAKSWKADWEGDMAGSEQETKALISFFHMQSSIGYIDFHSRGNSIYYYRKEMSSVYNKKQKMLADKLAATTGYTLEEPENEIGAGDSGGNTVHYYSEHIEMPAITIETVPEIAAFPLSMTYCQEVFQAIRHTPFCFVE